MKISRRQLLKATPLLFVRGLGVAADAPQLFGPEFPQLDSLTTGEWWNKGALAAASNGKPKNKGGVMRWCASLITHSRMACSK